MRAVGAVWPEGGLGTHWRPVTRTFYLPVSGAVGAVGGVWARILGPVIRTFYLPASGAVGAVGGGGGGGFGHGLEACSEHFLGAVGAVGWGRRGVWARVGGL